MNFTEKQIWTWLEEIPDPEIPVITIVELGVLRKVQIKDDTVFITITPTYTGCPAMKMFEDDIHAKLKKEGVKKVEIKTVHSPAWTTDWITDHAKEKLRKYGIAPPVSGSADKGVLFASGPKAVPCPKCKSTQTTIISQFGSTACKALYKCDTCHEPFEYFKCI